MIAAHNYVAVFNHADGIEYTRPVLAWGDQGEPLVADPGRGLIPVDAEWAASTFVRLQLANPPATVIPGGGWMATYTEHAGTEQTAPIVAWRIDSLGVGHPLVTDDSGSLHDLTDPGETDLSEPVHVWHPAQSPRPQSIHEGEAA
ncbi:hypothetical protein ACFV1N_05880 [Streptosporangium canum]|uniref:hypothetical protein n=1 Tax=Streptosporangium canum TaxID=324952 RepID=UPI0036B279C1